MAEQIRFTEGLSRRVGAPIQAPYDLSNARLRDGQGVEAVLPPRTPSTDTPSAPGRLVRSYRQGDGWIQAEASVERGKTRIVTNPAGTSPPITVYRGGRVAPTARIPQIASVDVSLGGSATIDNPFSESSEQRWPRYIYYLLVPINDLGEAGPFFYVGSKLPRAQNVTGISSQSEISLPSLSITGNAALRWIEVYRTPAFFEGGNEITPGAQAFYEAARIGAAGGGVGVASEALHDWAVTLPPWDEVWVPGSFFAPPSSVYYQQTGIDYIYLSSNPTIEDGGYITGTDLPSNPTSWRIRFNNLSDPSASSLVEESLYSIYNVEEDSGGGFRFYIQETDGSAVSFDAKHLFHAGGFEGTPAEGSEIVRGAEAQYVPPSGVGTTEASALYSDDKNWYIDVGEDQKEQYAPTGATFDRPFNAYAAHNFQVSTSEGQVQIEQTGGSIQGDPTVSTSESQGATAISVSTDASDRVHLQSGAHITFGTHLSRYEVASDVTIAASSSGVITLSSGLDEQVPSGTTIFGGVRAPRARDLHYQGGILYAAAPEWPAKRPHPMYVEKDSEGGFDLRLQYEYSMPGGETLGPPIKLADVSKLSVGWQGSEEALHVFTKGGTPSYDILSASMGTTNLTINGAPDWWLQEVSEGYPVEVVDDGSFVLKTVVSISGSPDVTIEVGSDGFAGGGLLLLGRDQTTLSQNTGDLSSNDVIAIEDPNNVFSSAISLHFENGDTYGVQSASHSSGVTTITTYNTVESYSEGTGVTLRFLEGVDTAAVATFPRVVVQDPQDDLGALASGVTIDIEGGPNEGDHILASGALSDTPMSGRTTIPVQALSEPSGEGEVLFGLGGQNWALYRRLTVGPYGQYTRSGSTFAFSATAYSEGTTQGRLENVTAYADRIREGDAVFLSNVDRPLEITFDQFEVPEGQEVRAVFRSRLAEEEGIRSYRFYVATGQAVYVADPDEAERSVSVFPVTTSFGIGRTRQSRPCKAFVTGGVVLKATNGHLYVLSGRKAERVFPDGQVPWEAVWDLAYDQQEETLLIATDTGLWGFARDRGALTSHHDLQVGQLIWDEGRGQVLAYDTGASAWRALHRTGWPVESVSSNNITLTEDWSADFSALDLVEVVTSSGTEVLEVSTVVTSGGQTVLSFGGSIPVSSAEVVKKYATAAVETQPITHGGDEVGIGGVRVDYDPMELDLSSSSSMGTLTQSRRESGQTRQFPVPPRYRVYPPLRGTGLQLRFEDFVELSELRIEGVEPAN